MKKLVAMLCFAFLLTSCFGSNPETEVEGDNVNTPVEGDVNTGTDTDVDTDTDSDTVTGALSEDEMTEIDTLLDEIIDSVDETATGANAN